VITSSQTQRSDQPKNQFLESLEAAEREVFIKKYLQSPFSVRWSTLAALTSEPPLVSD
jgi:hypothetical protein